MTEEMKDGFPVVTGGLMLDINDDGTGPSFTPVSIEDDGYWMRVEDSDGRECRLFVPTVSNEV